MGDSKIEVTEELLDKLEPTEEVWPGPWYVLGPDDTGESYWSVACRDADGDEWYMAEYLSEADARHIAAANPDVVKALVAEVRRLRRALEKRDR